MNKTIRAQCLQLAGELGMVPMTLYLQALVRYGMEYFTFSIAYHTQQKRFLFCKHNTIHPEITKFSHDKQITIKPLEDFEIIEVIKEHLNRLDWLSIMSTFSFQGQDFTAINFQDSQIQFNFYKSEKPEKDKQ